MRRVQATSIKNKAAKFNTKIKTFVYLFQRDRLSPKAMILKTRELRHAWDGECYVFVGPYLSSDSPKNLKGHVRMSAGAEETVYFLGDKLR